MNQETNTPLQINPEQQLSNLEAATIHADELLRDAPLVQHDDGRVTQTVPLLERDSSNERKYSRYPYSLTRIATEQGDEFTLNAHATTDMAAFIKWTRDGQRVRVGNSRQGEVMDIQDEPADSIGMRVAADVLSQASVFHPDTHKIIKRPQGEIIRRRIGVTAVQHPNKSRPAKS